MRRGGISVEIRPVFVIELVDHAVVAGVDTSLISFSTAGYVVEPDSCICAEVVESVVGFCCRIQLIETCLPVVPGFFTVAIYIAEIACAYFVDIIFVSFQFLRAGISFPLIVIIFVQYINVAVIAGGNAFLIGAVAVSFGF